jgi:NADP-dependent 3-hydroxy acid dehydrogenase YdfG
MLDGQISLVTGAASGLGLAIARALAAAGSRLIALDRDEQILQKLAAKGAVCTENLNPHIMVMKPAKDRA